MGGWGGARGCGLVGGSCLSELFGGVQHSVKNEADLR